MSILTKSMLVLATLALISAMIGYCVTLAYHALPPITVSHAIPAGQWKHHAGFSDYEKVARANP